MPKTKRKWRHGDEFLTLLPGVIFYLDLLEEIDGGALEGLVAQHLRTWCTYRKRDDRLYYWRTKSSNEVDFVDYGEASFVAIEVKRAMKIIRNPKRPCSILAKTNSILTA